MFLLAKVKSLLQEIQIPRGFELVVCLGFVAVYALFNAFSICGDCFFGYAITDSLRHPEWRVVGDLVTASSNNFLFYKIMAWFPFFSNNFNLRDFVLTTPITALLVLAWYNVFREVLPNRRLVLLSTFFLLFSDTKLYLHGYPIPFFILTSIGSVHFLQIFAFFFFLRRRYIASFVILALTSYLHPASAIVYLSILGVCLVWTGFKTSEYRRVVAPCVAAFLIMLPNYVLLSKGLVATSEELRILFDVSFQTKQFSSLYISEYIDKTYFYTFSALALTFFVFFKKKFSFNHEETILRFVVVGLIGSAVWLINLYFFQNTTIFYTCFVARAFYIIKPLLLMYIVSVFDDLASHNNWLARLASLLLPVSLITLSSFVGGLILLSAIGWYTLEQQIPSLAERKKISFGRKEVLFLGGVVVLIAVVFGYLRGNKFLKIYRLLRGENTFNFSFDFNKNYSVSRTNPEFSALVDWAKEYQGKMFLVPLDGRNDFVYFRYFTKNGIYANIDDMGQLTYTPKAYVEGYKRMTNLGFKIIKPGELDFSAYNTQPIEKLQATNADFAIFDKYSPGWRPRKEPAFFETPRYYVIRLK